MTLTLSLLLLLPGADPVFAAHSATVPQSRGTLTQLGPDWSVTLGSAKVTGSDLIWLRRADDKLPPRPEGAHVRFANGDLLAGTCSQLANDRLRFVPRFGRQADLPLPLTVLSAIWLEAPADRDQLQAIQRQLAEPRNRDIVWLRNGDVLEGTVLRFDADELTLESAGKPVKVERRKLAVIGLNTELARLAQPKGPYARLVLVDGSRLSLHSAKADRQALTAKTVFGSDIQVPLEQVDGLDIHQGRAVFLSDLKPKAFEEKPYFAGSRWPYRVDRSVAGNDLRLAGNTFDKGIGMHSASRLTYALDGQYRRFEAVVGLDEITGKLGRATVRVVVDGKAQDLGWNGDLKGSDAPRTLNVNLTGAKELTLVVEFGADGLDVQDHVNWADARLIRN